MTKHTVIVKRPDEEMEIIEFDGRYRCDLKTLICDEENTILDYVMLGRSGDRCFAMACDQDGIFKSLPPNFNLITQSGRHRFLSNIVGTVVFFCYQWEDVWEKEIWDFELLDLDQAQINNVEKILSEPYQEELLAAKSKDPSIHHNTVILTSFQPVSLAHLTFFFLSFGFPGLKMKFCAQPDCTEEYEMVVKRSRKNQDVIVCSGATTAYEIKLPIPAFSFEDRSQDGKAVAQRIAKIHELRRSLRAIEIPDVVYVTEGNVEKLAQEVRIFENMCHLNRDGYMVYLDIMYDYDSATMKRIYEILEFAVHLPNPNEKRKYIERYLAGILPPAEILRINIENWE